MAYGSSDYAAEDMETIRKLDDLVTEAKKLLTTCKEFINSGDDSLWAKSLLSETIDKFIEKKV